MTNQNDLPLFGDSYLQYFNQDLQRFELRRKSRNEGILGISETMELVEKVARRHQLSFVPNSTNKKLILLPFAFIPPQAGDKIRNGNTGEIYTIEEVIVNPTTNQWNGLVKLSLINPPTIESRDWLEYLNFNRYIKFEHEFPSVLVNKANTNPEGVQAKTPPIEPTITWSLTTKEPGGLGKAFDSRKELKPRLRESVKDPFVPGYTVEIYGQFFDNIVQFNAWSNSHRTTERLTSWIEQLLKLYTGYLRRKGVSNMFFWRRSPDDLNNAWRQEIPTKGTQFYFRTEEIEAVYQRDILKIDISLGTDEKIVNGREMLYIADQLISGNYTPDEYRSLFYRSGEYLFGNIDILQ